MLFKSLLSIALLAVHVAAHAAIAPMLNVQGKPTRNNVQRPSNNKPCGNTALSAIDTSKAVTADASGNFNVDITNFNGGTDGSRSVTLKVDASGKGTNFVAGTMIKNGQASPAGTGTETLTAQLPADAKCAGGQAGNLCLASFTTKGGFGNCVVVAQGAAAAAAAPPAAAPATGGGGNNGSDGDGDTNKKDQESS